MNKKKKAIVFLGTGAAAGSGIKIDGKNLPTDAGFFKSNIVKEEIIKDNFEALNYFREKYNKVNDLSVLWQEIYLYRNLACAQLIKDDPKKVGEVIQTLGGNKYYHYKLQIKIMDYEHEYHPSQKKPHEYYVAELALWDIGRLIYRVFEKAGTTKNYVTFYEKLKDLFEEVIVVSMNYETTFDDSFRNEKIKPKIIRPHGSLKWVQENVFSLEKDNWDGEWVFTGNNEDRLKNFDKEFGYREGFLKDGAARLLYKGISIIPSHSIKEEIIGNSTMPPFFGHNRYRNEWIEMAKELKEADHWIFYGLSFCSGDDHLITLLRQILSCKNNVVKSILCTTYKRICMKDERALKKLQACFDGYEVKEYEIGRRDTIDKFKIQDG